MGALKARAAVTWPESVSQYGVDEGPSVKRISVLLCVRVSLPSAAHTPTPLMTIPERVPVGAKFGLLHLTNHIRHSQIC